MTVIAIVLASIVIGWNGVSWWMSSRAEKGWVAYNEAMKAPEAQRWELLKKVYTEQGKSRATTFAAVALADHYFDEAKKELAKAANANASSAGLAVEWYGKALEFKALVFSEKQLLWVNSGKAYEIQKKYDEALKNYKTAADLGGDLKAYAMLNEARVMELKSDTPKAIETYEKISTDFLNTEYGKMAKNYLRRLKSPMLGSQKL